MKLYKFRSLGSPEDVRRARRMLETGEFWCSGFSELNDPMEGSFTTELPHNVVDLMYGSKSKFKICSFSGRKALENPIMWGYYANGFSGLVIEIEVKKGDVSKIQYTQSILSINDRGDLDTKTKKVLTSKLISWEHEDEYRFLRVSDVDFHKIGEITAVYWGNPYGRAINKKLIYSNNKNLQNFARRKTSLINIFRGPKHFSVRTGKRGIEILEIEDGYKKSFPTKIDNEKRKN